jgi:ATP-dependent exoDNAse (exonuclease V) beta subunit
MREFKFQKLDTLNFDLKSITTDKGRMYETPTGELYPSITTVLSSYNKKSIMEWRQRVGEETANKISAKAAGRGTKLHDACEKYLLNEMTDMKIKTLMPDVKDFFFQLKEHIDKNVGIVYGLEQPLYSHYLSVAGRCDCIAEWDGELSIVDYKTSSKIKEENYIQNYFMQCSAYATMFSELTGKQVNRIVVAIANDEGKPQIFVRERQQYMKPLQEMIAKYRQSLN